ncbi:hypothetical protein GCM10027570_18810 [Streptomonospora sediminis]
MHDTIDRLVASFQRARSYAGPERAQLLLVTKSALAATAAWALAVHVVHAQSPAFAPFAAVLIIQVTVRESVVRSLRFVVAAVLGVSLQGLLGFFFEADLFTFFAVAVVALALGQWRRLRQQGGLVTTSAFFAYSVFITGDGAIDRVAVLAELVGLVLLGCAIGLAVNVLLLPPVRYRGARYGLTNTASALHDLLGEMAESMCAGSVSSDDCADWAYRVGRIESLGNQAQESIAGAREAMRWNPRRLLNRPQVPLDGYSHLINEVSAAGGRLRSVTDILRRRADTSDPAQAGFLQRYGEILDDFRVGVRILADLPPGPLHEADGEFGDSLVRAREVHDDMAQMAGPGTDATGGHGNLGDPRLYGGLLVEAERMLLEMEAAHETLLRSPRPTGAG